jgi:hypothetical protein
MYVTTLLRCSLAVVCAVAAAGCGTAAWDRRDAPWDPRGSAALFDQIPPGEQLRH